MSAVTQPGSDEDGPAPRSAWGPALLGLGVLIAFAGTLYWQTLLDLRETSLVSACSVLIVNFSERS